jgi:hypothetical protein
MVTVRTLAWCLLGICLGLIGVAGGMFVYADSVGQRSEETAERFIRESQQKWCGIVTLFDDTYKANPPQTPTGQRLAGEMTALRTHFGC